MAFRQEEKIVIEHPAQDRKQKKTERTDESQSTPYLFECYFIDVGQGNCTIIKVYEKPTAFHCWIFDGGSSHYPNYIRAQPTKCIEICKKLITLIGEPLTLNVIISHPDADHYNFLRILFSYTRSSDLFCLRKRYPLCKFYINKLFCENKPFVDHFLKITKKNKFIRGTAIPLQMIDLIPVEKGIGFSWDGTIKEPPPPSPNNIQNALSGSNAPQQNQQTQNNYDIYLLNCIPDITEKDQGKKETEKKTNKTKKNDDNDNDNDDDANDDEEEKNKSPKENNEGDHNTHSLLVQITYCNNIILLTGDATEKTFKWAKNVLPKKVLCLQVPHHGADGSLNEELLLTDPPSIDAELIIISSHIDASYRHPKPTLIDLCLKHLAKRKKPSQRQSWHLVPFIREQYLHELPKHVSSWHNWYNVIPLAMGRSKSGKQKTVYATNLGLYSTTWERSYCLTLSKKIEQYKLDYFTLQSEEFRRDYFLQEMGKTLESFSEVIFRDLKKYLPCQDTTWTGICFPTDFARQHFLDDANKETYLRGIEFIDFRLCKDPLYDLTKSIAYLENLVSVLLPDKTFEAMEDKTKVLLLKKLLGKLVQPEEVTRVLGLSRQMTSFNRRLDEVNVIWPTKKLQRTDVDRLKYT
jgi:beta-lactamase superfamily II metal-dependent hydrolase